MSVYLLWNILWGSSFLMTFCATDFLWIFHISVPSVGELRTTDPKNECICEAVLSQSPKSVIYVSDPDYSKRFLICVRNGQILKGKCPKVIVYRLLLAFFPFQMQNSLYAGLSSLWFSTLRKPDGIPVSVAWLTNSTAGWLGQWCKFHSLFGLKALKK